MAQQNGTRTPMSTGKKLAIGAAVLVGGPAFIAGAISGAKDSLTANDRAAAGTRPAAPVSSPAPSPPSATPKITPEGPIDQDGDDGTPCAMTYQPSPDRKSTITRYALSRQGELIAHLDGPGGLTRHDQTDAHGMVEFTDPIALGQVTGAGAILQIGDQRFVCSIHAAG